VAPERTLIDDLRWAAAVLAGFVLGALILGADWSVLLGAVVGVTFVVVVRTVLRRRRASRG
jgi:hypothetical protein